MAEAALTGLRLIEIGSGRASELCGRLFADHGAEVIRIDLPGAPASDHGRGKQAVAIDFREAAGAALVQACLRKADFLLLGAPPHPPLTPEPGLIRIEPGADFSDNMAPHAAVLAAFGALAALQQRSRSGEGQTVRVAPDAFAADAIAPSLDLTPGAVRWPAPVPGADTEAVLHGLLRLSAADCAQLRAAGVI